MGQLEKYGLYVLCLVIFLILGVTIWPGDAVAAPGQEKAAVKFHESPLSGRSDDVPGDGGEGRRAQNATLADIGRLLEPAPKPKPAPGVGGGQGGGGQGAREQPSSQPSQTPPAAKPEPKPQPAPTAPRSYRVKSGDTLGEIAMRELGSVRFVGEIQRLNGGLEPRDLRAGQEILLPARAATEGGPAGGDEAFERAGAFRSYVIAKGDNFERIALRELGSRGRVAEIRQLNADVDPRRLIPGKTLKLPVK